MLSLPGRVNPCNLSNQPMDYSQNPGLLGVHQESSDRQRLSLEACQRRDVLIFCVRDIFSYVNLLSMILYV